MIPNDFKKEAEEFLKKRSIQKDNLVITRNEAISALSDFAVLIINLSNEKEKETKN